MYDMTARQHALNLLSQGRSLNSVSGELGISRSALRSWKARPSPLRSDLLCPRCQGDPDARPPGAAYAYLLGLYLGDGCISPLPRGVHLLRIACADAWPGLIDSCAEAVRAARPGNRVGRVTRQGCTYVTSYSKHWPCLFPQHGPGRKHDRRIVLESWQREIVDASPWEFVRGLVHSDGCRNMNWTTRIVGGEVKRYEYARYFFTNVSDDIRRLYTDTLDSLGVEWRTCVRGGRPYSVSVARRASVALMDAHVGPKH
ncbi:helix-turn-helix domain-containing protein [Streptomyces genisteinicus]|uniref:Transcriptional regulator n=1 Tax=Streptomyces genisteinicus TaxID=2768068 RepID=A0A7H0HQG5_9ACTN|nr:helix-turn-helix domain-containing protein [Streptomyces genisteinicus]QNP62781.1 transcriptional regulator [Streptomyces genisteinicus]